MSTHMQDIGFKDHMCPMQFSLHHSIRVVGLFHIVDNTMHIKHLTIRILDMDVLYIKHNTIHFLNTTPIPVARIYTLILYTLVKYVMTAHMIDM